MSTKGTPGTVKPASEVTTKQAKPKVACFRVRSSDGVVVKISELAAEQSKTLHGLITNMSCTPKPRMEPIPLDEVRGAVLKKIVKWCEHHKGEPLAEPVNEANPRTVVISEWDAKFLNVDNDELFELIMAANYMNIQQLITLACKKIADMAKGKSPMELQRLFDIPSDMDQLSLEGPSSKRN